MSYLFYVRVLLAGINTKHLFAVGLPRRPKPCGLSDGKTSPRFQSLPSKISAVVGLFDSKPVLTLTLTISPRPGA